MISDWAEPLWSVRVGTRDKNDVLAGCGLVRRFDRELYRQVVKAKKLEAYHHFGQTRVFMPDDPLNPRPGTTTTRPITTR